MGTGLRPAWFSREFASLAAHREPFPDLHKWQTTYVRYLASETAQAQGWDADSCRRNLHRMGINDHPVFRELKLPDAIKMSIIEAPAEFALPVKQDRRLLPCFKVRLEAQHRGALNLPLTLRAHVLSQQDKEQISTWLPVDNESKPDVNVQRPATELKGTYLIQCTMEAAVDGQGLPRSAQGRALRSADRAVKLEPSHSFNNGTANDGGGSSGIGDGSRNLSGLQSDQLVPEPCGLMDSTGLTANGMLRNVAAAAAGLKGPVTTTAATRGVNLNSLFAADRPDPVITLASSGCMSATISSLPGLGAGLCMNTSDTPDALDVTMEILMQQQQPLQYPQQRRPGALEAYAVGGGGGGRGQLISDMQWQLQRREEEQSQQRQQQQQQQREQAAGSIVDFGNGNGSGSMPKSSGNLIVSVQDFEFTNLELLKPTRMNKIYLAFAASILDTDMLFVVFDVPTIGICRAEQREKACKKLHIDYRLLWQIDQGGVDRGDRFDRDRDRDRNRADAVTTAFLTPTGGGLRGPSPESNLQSSIHDERYAASCRHPGHDKSPAQPTQQHHHHHQQQTQQHHQHPMRLQDPQFLPRPLSPSPSSGVQSVGAAAGGVSFETRQDAGRLPSHASDADYPRMPSGLDLNVQLPSQGSQHLQQQHQQIPQHLLQHLQQQQHLQQHERLLDGCGGVVVGGTAPGPQVGGLSSGGGGSSLQGGVLPHPGILPQGAMSLGGLGGPGVLGGGTMAAGGGMLPSSMASFGRGSTISMDCDLGSRAAVDFLFGGVSVGNGVNCGGGGSGGAGGGSGMGLGLGRGGSSSNPLSSGVAGMGIGDMGIGDLGPGSHAGLGIGIGGTSRKRDQGPTTDKTYRFQPVRPEELSSYQGFAGLTSSDMDMMLRSPHSRMAMRDFINEVYDSTALHRRLTHMDLQALLSQAGFPMESNREHDTISPQQWDEFCSQFRSIVNTLQQVASVWNMDDPVVISGFDMDRAGTIAALANEPAGTFICRFSMSQPGCLVLTCKVGSAHPRADAMGLIHAIIKIDDLHERRVDTWIRDYAGATHLLDVYRQKRVDKRKVFATNYTRLRGLDVGEEQSPAGPGQGQGYM